MVSINPIIISIYGTVIPGNRYVTIFLPGFENNVNNLDIIKYVIARGIIERIPVKK
tara:strand:+ start:540 stop:707 length:168 start_codon:yes stop_codon:yes gene_type:complete